MDNEIDVIKNRIKNKRLQSLDEKLDDSPKMKYLKNLLSRILITIIIVLVSVIFVNSSDKNLEFYKEKILTKTFSFAPFKNWYQKNFGDVIPIKIENEQTKTVFDNELVYSNIEKYENGFKLTVTNNSLISNITSGIVVYIGKKDNYGNTIIIQGIDGVDIWYGNITNTDLALYDYVEKETIIGETKDEFLYLVLNKDGEYLNYEEYIKQNKN